MDVCKFCGGPDEEDGQPTNSGTCGWCYYGQRLDPEQWKKDMAALGRPVRYRGGCIVVQEEPEGAAIVCRDPYVPKPRLVTVPRAGGEEG